MRDSASRFMLDTDCCVALLRGQAPRVVDRLRKLGLERVHLSAVTVGELLTWAARSRSPLESTVRVVRFCASLQVVSFDDRAAATYARARAALEERGTPIGPLDTLIARATPFRWASPSSPETPASSVASPVSRSRTGSSQVADALRRTRPTGR